MSWQEELESLQKELDDAKLSYMNKAKKVFMENLFPPFFEAHPEIKVVYWVQYTPYFNDGDQCVFNVGEVCLADVLPEEMEDFNLYESFVGGKETWRVPKHLKDDFNSISTFISNNEELMLDLFDDHAQVIVYNETPIRIESEEYEHD